MMGITWGLIMRGRMTRYGDDDNPEMGMLRIGAQANYEEGGRL